LDNCGGAQPTIASNGYGPTATWDRAGVFVGHYGDVAIEHVSVVRSAGHRLVRSPHSGCSCADIRATYGMPKVLLAQPSPRPHRMGPPSPVDGSGRHCSVAPRPPRRTLLPGLRRRPRSVTPFARVRDPTHAERLPTKSVQAPRRPAQTRAQSRVRWPHVDCGSR